MRLLLKEIEMTAKVAELYPKTENEIVLFFHCKDCNENIPDGMSRRDYQSIEVGWTEIGLQVWCKRHDQNIIAIDFEGHNPLVCEV